ncbi:hypothetical protein F4810DRAFT_660445 [Camillea tinctor]|nr:hypothetical protein F4810DRAFT_660445 [Camillea tinctor]
MSWTIVSQDDAVALFTEAVGGLACYLAEADIANGIVNWKSVQGKGPNKITDAEYKVIINGFTPFNLVSIGNFCIVLPLERYKKILAQAGNTTVDPADAFNLGDFTSAANLNARYPKTVVETFAGTSNRPRQWFNNCVRNSFAHGQSAYVNNPIVNDVTHKGTFILIYNATPKGTVNLKIYMPHDEFVDMMIKGLVFFVETVVQGKSYQPLTKLLNTAQQKIQQH